VSQCFENYRSESDQFPLRLTFTTRVIKMIWPSASRARELLNGAKVELNDTCSHGSDSRRPKRQAEAAFHNDAVLITEGSAFGRVEQSSRGTLREGVQQLGTQTQNQMLGLDSLPVKPSSSYIPGASDSTEWLDSTASPRSPMMLHGAYSSPNVTLGAQRLPDDWMPCVSDIRPGYTFPF
jgi:hypothetical protein